MAREKRFIIIEKKKMGRPTVSPKVNNYRIRLTDEELAMLNKCCEITGLTKADVLRLGIEKVYTDFNKD